MTRPAPESLPAIVAAECTEIKSALPIDVDVALQALALSIKQDGPACMSACHRVKHVGTTSLPDGFLLTDAAFCRVVQGQWRVLCPYN